MPNELKIEKDLLIDYMKKYILNNYERKTQNHRLDKTARGYSLSLRCAIYKPYEHNKSCSSRWAIQINFKDKSTHLVCKYKCRHIAASFRSKS